MHHLYQDAPHVNGHVDRQRPDTQAITPIPHRDVARTLGLHRPRGARVFRRFGIVALFVALAAVGGWLGLKTRTASGPVYRTEAVQRGEEQRKNPRLIGVQDLAWALINNPAFLFNR